MKKTILLVLMAVILATPCFAQEVEPEGIFSVDGTLWSLCYIEFGLAGFEFTSSMDCTSVGYYQDKVYWCEEGSFCSATNMFYIDLGLVGITYISVLGNGLAIMQPSIGLGVYSQIGFSPGDCAPRYCLPPSFGISIGIMFKTDDNWTPPEVE